MIQILYKKQDMRYLFFTGDSSELRKIEKEFNKTPSYQFLPSFHGIPRPEIFFHKFKSKTGQVIYYCHSGLWKTIVDWCNKNNIAVEYPEEFDYFKYTGFNMSLDEFREYVDSWEISLTPYPYQLRAAWLILKYRQSLSQLATRAGKTLICYMVFRYMLEHGAKKCLMIVPAKSLVKQAVNDFTEYAEFFNMETVWAGGELQESSNVTIGTFQSLVKKADPKSNKYDLRFFDDYDVILVDEAHTLKCQSINTILNQQFMKNIKLKFGFTGSLPQEHTIDSFCCHSLMGPTIQDIRSIELMTAGTITPIETTQIYINHQEDEDLNNTYIECGEYLNGISTGEMLDVDERKFTVVEKKELPIVLKQMKTNNVSRNEYREYLIDLCKARGSNLLMLEQMLLHRDTKRIDVIFKLLDGFEKNCIVFAHHTEYIKYLYNIISARYPHRNVYMITGQTTDKKREKIKQNLLIDKDSILVASYGCVGTGLTFKNLDYGIFAQGFKSHIINLQSLGRGLCLANDKDKYRLYDLVDCFPTRRIEMQGKSRKRLYEEQGFEYHIERV